MAVEFDAVVKRVVAAQKLDSQTGAVVVKVTVTLETELAEGDGLIGDLGALQHKATARKVRRGKYSPSAVVWHVGVRGTPDPQIAHHNIHFGDEWAGSFDALLTRGTLMPDPSRFAGQQPLVVTLVNAKSQTRPMKADALAQANLDGGGNTDAARRARSPLPVPREDRKSTRLNSSHRL